MASADSISIEVSTSYLYSRTAAYEIKEFNPEARIIIILRNPVDRAFSNYMYKLKTGNENCFEFEDALTREKERINEGLPYGFHYISMGFYCDQVKRYIDEFNKKNVLILLFEDLKSDPVQFYKNVSAFMGVEQLDDFDPSKRYNKSGGFRSKTFMNLLNSDNKKNN